MSWVTRSALLDVERVHQARDVRGLVLLRVSVIGMRREAHAAQVGDDDGVIRRQRRRDRRPHVTGVAEPVQHHDRGAMAADAHMQRRPVRRDLFAAKAVRKRRDRIGRRRERERANEGGEETKHANLPGVRATAGRMVKSAPIAALVLQLGTARGPAAMTALAGGALRNRHAAPAGFCAILDDARRARHERDPENRGDPFARMWSAIAGSPGRTRIASWRGCGRSAAI
jgi:hypothetical protein